MRGGEGRGGWQVDWRICKFNDTVHVTVYNNLFTEHFKVPSLCAVVASQE